MNLPQLLTPAGGSRAWRELTAVVLERDRWTCQMFRDGHRCGAPATTANHIVPRVYGGRDTLENLEAACAPCNFRAGGQLRARDTTAVAQHHNGVVRLVALLDQLGVPVDAGARTAGAAATRHAAHPWRRRDVEVACSYRRARGPLTRI